MFKQCVPYALSLLLCVMLYQPVRAQESDALHLDLANLGTLTESCTTATYWRYCAGDDPAYADPAYDDSDWKIAATVTEVKEWVERGDGALVWYRIHLKVDSSLWNHPVYLDFDIAGAAELYLNGRHLFNLGTVGATPETEEAMFTDRALPRAIAFSDKEDQLLAIRFSSADPRLAELTHEGLGFIFYPLASAQENSSAVNQLLKTSRQHSFFTGVTLSFALLHALMFFLYPRFRENLYFALLAFSCAGLTSAPAWYIALPHIDMFSVSLGILKAAMVVSVMCAQAILHSLFRPGIPWRFWLFALVGLVLIVLSVHIPTNIFFGFVAIALFETIGVTIRAMLTRERMAWVIGVGFIAFILAAIWEVLAGINILPQFEPAVPVYLLGIMTLIISMSLYLALRYADTSRSLEDKLALEKAHHELEQTHRKLRDTQAHLVQSEKMASLGQLVAGVAHEINTPIGAVASMHDTLVRAAERIKGAVNDGEKTGCDRCGDLQPMLKLIDDANKVIETGTERVTTIVRRLRSFARLDEAEMKEVDLHEGLEDTLQLIQHEIKNRITIVRDYGDIPPVTCFPGKLNQVFLNILNNARQAIAGEGQIKLTTQAEGGKVQISIEDTGAGIPPDKIDKVFDPGFTTKGVGVGTGLGLSICYQIVEEHRGEIKVESELGKGTKFIIDIPVRQDK